MTPFSKYASKLIKFHPQVHNGETNHKHEEWTNLALQRHQQKTKAATQIHVTVFQWCKDLVFLIGGWTHTVTLQKTFWGVSWQRQQRDQRLALERGQQARAGVNRGRKASGGVGGHWWATAGFVHWTLLAALIIIWPSFLHFQYIYIFLVLRFLHSRIEWVGVITTFQQVIEQTRDIFLRTVVCVSGNSSCS